MNSKCQCQPKSYFFLSDLANANGTKRRKNIETENNKNAKWPCDLLALILNLVTNLRKFYALSDFFSVFFFRELRVCARPFTVQMEISSVIFIGIATGTTRLERKRKPFDKHEADAVHAHTHHP